MNPHIWRAVHTVSFVVFLVSLGAFLAESAGILSTGWELEALVALVAALLAHYGSHPRRSWVLGRHHTGS